MKNTVLICIILLMVSCQNEVKKEPFSPPIVAAISTPCQEGGEPDLFVSTSGKSYLSWVEYRDDTTDVLMFSSLENDQWSAPKTIATGNNWFVNWADFPSLAAYKNNANHLAAHWLETSAEGTFDYDIHITQSIDGGNTWHPSFILHKDGIASEHGFVSLLPLSGNRIFATWLDGRNMGGKSQNDHDHSGAMTLRAATFDIQGNLYDEVELDNRVCDCCSTSAARTDKGIIVAYRNRSEEEIRDIYVIRKEGEKWTKPKAVFNDNWHISGCPVNGASIKAEGQHVAIVWFSAPDDSPEVKVAFSTDSGETFSKPVRIDNGQPMGRVDLVLLDKGEALASWMEKTNEGAAIKATRVNSRGKIGEDIIITSSQASRQSGFPRMVKSKNRVIFAWTEVDSLTKVKTAILK